jgi:hypothetical protein
LPDAIVHSDSHDIYHQLFQDADELRPGGAVEIISTKKSDFSLKLGGSCGSLRQITIEVLIW